MRVFTFKWILENFQFCQQKKGTFLKSPAFIVDNIERSKWSVSIYPRGNKLEQWISLYLNREEDSKGPASIEIDYEFAFLALDGSVLTSATMRILKRAFLRNDSDGYHKFKERESVFADRSTFLPQGALTIVCRMWTKDGRLDTIGECIARTRISVERKSFLWEIKDFSTFDVGQEMTFRLKKISDDKAIMYLKLFLRKNQSSYALIIKFLLADKSISFSTFKSSLVDIQGDYVDCGKHEIWFSPTLQSEECMLSLSKETLMDKNYLYLPHNTLTLYCEQAFSTGTVLEGIEMTEYDCSICSNCLSLPAHIAADIKKSDSDMKKDLGSMLQGNILSDVKLCVEKETFPAHWFMLNARSPVFRAMFQSDMKEKAQDRIVIKDLKPDTVRRMLHFMYTDSFEGLEWETASDLCVAAEKYEIMTLKDECSAFLKSNLSLSNACEILLLSDLLNDKELKSIVQGFILKNDKSIINSSDWKLLMKDNLHLAAETMLLKFKE